MTDLTPDTSQGDSSPNPASTAGQTGASPTNPPAVTAAAPAQAAPAARPTWVPESFWDAEKSAPKEKEFSEHLASLEKLKADTEAKRGAIPAKAEDYKPDLGDIKLPEGVEIDLKDPYFVELQKAAHEEGLTAAAFNKVMSIEAKRIVAFREGVAAQRDKRNEMLGENGAARVDALSKWIDAQFTDPKEATQVKATMWTPVIVKFFEKIQQAAAGQGLHGFTQIGRETADRDDGKPDGWEKMAPIDRRTWQLQENRRKQALT
jgi:hypothetical protein